MGGLSRSQSMILPSAIAPSAVAIGTVHKDTWMGRMVRYKRVMSNWLNGLPTEEAPFDPDGVVIGGRRSRQPTSDGNMDAAGRSTNQGFFKKMTSKLRRRRVGSDDALNPSPSFDNLHVKTSGDSKQRTRVFQVPSLSTTLHQQTGGNRVKTAKYTLFTFIPKNLYEQFHRVANFYFLLVIILQFIPAISNVSPYIAMLPLLVICTATAIKDALEDWRRHSSDNKVNYAMGRVLRRRGVEEGRAEWVSASTPKLPDSNNKTSIRTRLQQHLSKASWWMKQRLWGVRDIDSPNDPEGSWRQKYWQDLAVGDIILVQEDEVIPADLLILGTSEPEGRCFVETMNLDGETNLKIRAAILPFIRSAEDAGELQALVECEQPSPNLHSFHGNIVIPQGGGGGEGGVSVNDGNVTLPVTLDHVLLRGCTVRNCRWVIGCCLYTGGDTKLMLNTGVTPSKRSRIERQMNPQIVLSFILLFVICVACAIVQGRLVSNTIVEAPFWYSSYGSKAFASGWFTGFLTFWSSMVLFQTLVPISLYITVEVCKTVQAYLIHQDADMIDGHSRKCVPRAWNISDDLGQIEYLFSDKTGTLTRNVMEFRMCSIKGHTYGKMYADGAGEERERAEGEMADALKSLIHGYVPPTGMSFVDPSIVADMNDNIVDFFFSIAVCHTVLVEDTGSVDGNPVTPLPTTIQYKAQSPDEAALVSSARDLGFAFLGRQHDWMRVSVLGREERVRLLECLEFTSARKRMSVIVEDEAGSIWLYCKGADSIIMDRLCENSNPPETVEKMRRDLDHFAETGLRTLCLAKRRLIPEEYREWSSRYRRALAAMDDRDALVDAESDCIERELTLLGATGIEDRLQEGVPECIATLREAGVKIWVLTGDKLETAINIAFSCRLLTQTMILLVVNGADDDTVCKQLREALEQQWSVFPGGPYYGTQQGREDVGEFALVIEGTSLRFALRERCRRSFLDLACKCRAVICCRTSPLQKAKVVELVKRHRHAMTMAVGDGANDVSMIQAADVGVGIVGEEGMQAVMASDYAIGQFRFLERLLLLHGRWSYHRAAEATLCSFHKNIAFVVSAFWYQWSCAFTSNYIYDAMYANFFNILLAMPPILLLGCFDQDVPADAALHCPPLYRRGIQQRSYSLKWFLVYLANGLWQSLSCFFIPRLAYSDAIVDIYGHPEAKIFLGNATGLSVIFCVNAFVLFNTKAWTAVILIGFGLTTLALLLLMTIGSVIRSAGLFGSFVQFWQPRSYAVCILAIVVALAPQILFKAVQSQCIPNDVDIIRELGGEYNKAVSGGLDEDVPVPDITPPEEALVRRRSSTTELREDAVRVLDISRDVEVGVKRKEPLARRLSTAASRLVRTVSDRSSLMMSNIVNMGTRRVERRSGYAFSQQDRGTGSIVHNSNTKKET